MHHKAIKTKIRKQLKTQYPNWQSLTKKEKKVIAKRVLDETVYNHEFKQDVQPHLAHYLESSPNCRRLPLWI